MLLRNSRHHAVRSLIATALKKRGWSVEEEIFCLATNDSVRRADILAFKSDDKGIIVDPTIRFEMGRHQVLEVHEEKKLIYEPTIDYFKNKYGLNEITVYGLLIGARGTISSFFEDFRQKFQLTASLRDDIVMSVLKKSCQILSNHFLVK